MKFVIISAYLDAMYAYEFFCKENYSLVSNYNYDWFLYFIYFDIYFCFIDACFIIHVDQEMNALALWEVATWHGYGIRP